MIFSQVKNVMGSATLKQNHRHEGSGRIVRAILVNREAHQSSRPLQPDKKKQNSYLDREKRPPQAPAVRAVPKDINGLPEEKTSANDPHGFRSERLERCIRNKDRPDRVVWTPLRRSDGSHTNDKSLSSASLSAKSPVDSEGKRLYVARVAKSRLSLFVKVLEKHGMLFTIFCRHFLLPIESVFCFGNANKVLADCDLGKVSRYNCRKMRNI